MVAILPSHPIFVNICACPLCLRVPFVSVYYDGQQVVETRLPDGQGGLQPDQQYVWSARYVDSPILRDSYSGGVLVSASRLYYLTDANHNVTAVTNSAGVVQERYDYRGNKGDRRIYWGKMRSVHSPDYPLYAPVPFTFFQLNGNGAFDRR